MGHYTLGASKMEAGPLSGSVGHYTLGASKMAGRATEWKRGTLHTRCKQDESRGHWVEAWDTTN